MYTREDDGGNNPSSEMVPFRNEPKGSSAIHPEAHAMLHLDRRVTRVEVVTEALSDRLDEQHTEFREFRAEVNARFDKVDARFDKIDARFDQMDTRFYKFLLIYFGSLVTAVLGLAGIMAKGFHWL